MEIYRLIKKASEKLKKNKISSYQLDTEILMSKVLNKKREYLISNQKEKLDFSKQKYFKKLIFERSMGKPLSYLTGKKAFWKYEFFVNKQALIPRPDTELIVEKVLNCSKKKTKLNILEIGVGSGCILLSILKERKDFNGVGIDISKGCIDLSKINSRKLGIYNRVKFFKSDVDNFTNGKYDLIVSNPPYIKKLDIKYLEKDIACFEPKIAIDGGLDGISEIRKVINNSSDLIKLNGKLILEIAFNQKIEVLKMLKCKGFYINNVFKDYARNDRCIVSTKI
tara:strand:- start:713 stop:1555 length:843 start_codon:yes stop_codon:yes gene_type:complete